MHHEQQHVEHRGGVIGTADSGSVHGIVTGARRAQQPGLSPGGTKQVKAPVESRLGKRDSTAREQDVDFVTIFLARVSLSREACFRATLSREVGTS